MSTATSLHRVVDTNRRIVKQLIEPDLLSPIEIGRDDSNVQSLPTNGHEHERSNKHSVPINGHNNQSIIYSNSPAISQPINLSSNLSISSLSKSTTGIDAIIDDQPISHPIHQPIQQPIQQTISQDERDDLDCNICLFSSTEPVVTPCGHIFCWACLYRYASFNRDNQPIINMNVSTNQAICDQSNLLNYHS